MSETRISLTLKQIKQEFNRFSILILLYSLYLTISFLFLDNLIIYLDKYVNISLSKIRILLVLGIMFTSTIIFFTTFKHNKKIKIYSKESIQKVEFNEFFKVAVIGYAINLVGTFFVSLITMLFPVEPKILLPIGSEFIYSNVTSYSLIFISIILLTVIEEYIYRGIILNYFRRYSVKLALVVSSILNAILHLNYLDFISAFVFSMYLGLVIIKYKNWLFSLFIHLSFNLLIICSNFLIQDYYYLIIFATIFIYCLAMYFWVVYKPIKVSIPYEKNTKLYYKLVLKNIFMMLVYIIVIVFLFRVGYLDLLIEYFNLL